MPSGHSALAFSMGVSISIMNGTMTVLIISCAIASMIALSRIFLKIHTFTEVLAGSALGAVVTFLLFKLFYLNTF